MIVEGGVQQRQPGGDIGSGGQVRPVRGVPGDLGTRRGQPRGHDRRAGGAVVQSADLTHTSTP